VECGYEGPDHEYAWDWLFGGADQNDPRADARWKPNTYTYYDERLDIICTTQTPLCDDQAIDEFTRVAGMGPKYKPRYLSVLRPNSDKPEMLPWEYDFRTDTAREVRRGGSQAEES
jgi:TPR repeat protein